MAKDNFYFPFMYKDWLIKTKFISNELKGIYIDLICYDFDYGGLPDDDNVLLSLVNYKGRKSAEVLSFIRSKFVQVDIDGAKVLRNKTVIEVTNKIDKIVDKRRIAAKAKWDKYYANAEQEQSKSKADAMLTNKIKENKRTNKVYIKEEDYVKLLTPLAFTPNFKNELVKHFRCIKTNNRLTKEAAETLIENIEMYVNKYGEVEVIKKVKESIVAGYPNIYEPKTSQKQDKSQQQSQGRAFRAEQNKIDFNNGI